MLQGNIYEDIDMEAKFPYYSTLNLRFLFSKQNDIIYQLHLKKVEANQSISVQLETTLFRVR